VAKAKQIAGIDCDAPAAVEIRLVPLSWRRCAQREAALDFSDPEGVHDIRVASRRLRSALRDFMPNRWKQRLTLCLGGIRDVAAALRRVRDQDVAVLTLDKLADKAPQLVGDLLLLTCEQEANWDKAESQYETLKMT